TTMIFAPDGVLQWMSLADLPVDGAPLVERVDVVRVPSASFLVERRAAKPSSVAGRGIVALVGRARDRPALPAAVTESTQIARRFREFRALAPPDSARDLAAATAGQAVLHVAAPVEADDRHPWRSGVRVGGAAGEKGMFRASSIASLHLTPALVFL